MSLLEQAALDVRAILTDEGGFSLPITLTSPSGESATIRGFAADIGQSVDPETGVPVVSRRVSVALPLADIAEAGIGQPKGVADENQRPWVASFQLPSSRTAQRFKVVETMPDRIGCLTAVLEVLQ